MEEPTSVDGELLDLSNMKSFSENDIDQLTTRLESLKFPLPPETPEVLASSTETGVKLVINKPPALIINTKVTQEEPNCFKYTPSCFRPDLFTSLYQELFPFCQSYQSMAYGKTYTTPRISCFFTDDPKIKYGYARSSINPISFSQVPIISQIKEAVEWLIGMKFNGCLAHIYRDGHDYISYHNDKEAYQHPVNHIASISFGTTRKFRFRLLGKTSGWEHEFELNNGDLFYMFGQCQQTYQHSIPKQLRVKDPRINLTFRVFIPSK